MVQKVIDVLIMPHVCRTSPSMCVELLGLVSIPSHGADLMQTTTSKIEGQSYIEGLNIVKLRPVSSVRTVPFVSLSCDVGSERQKEAESSGARFKEAQKINGSLSALGRVMKALSEAGSGQPHIPYRDSKLTHILRVRACSMRHSVIGTPIVVFIIDEPVNMNSSNEGSSPLTDEAL